MFAAGDEGDAFTFARDAREIGGTPPHVNAPPSPDHPFAERRYPLAPESMRQAH